MSAEFPLVFVQCVSSSTCSSIKQCAYSPVGLTTLFALEVDVPVVHKLHCVGRQSTVEILHSNDVAPDGPTRDRMDPKPLLSEGCQTSTGAVRYQLASSSTLPCEHVWWTRSVHARSEAVDSQNPSYNPSRTTQGQLPYSRSVRVHPRIEPLAREMVPPPCSPRALLPIFWCK